MDIQAQQPLIETPLAKVGINELRVPIKYRTKDGDPIKLETVVSMYVNLTPEVRGINMSRLPRVLYEYIDKNRDISTELMKEILRRFQKDLGSEDAYLKFRFNYPIRKQSLITKASGWIYYPVEFEAKLVDSEIVYTMMVQIYYSSTCPCSDHLSQMLQERKVIRNGKEISIESLTLEEKEKYSEKNLRGTAHAQRSRADVKIRFLRENPVWIEDVVAKIEEAIGTPVQAIVKREDEQEFARRNAQNLMFVEDSVRIISSVIDKMEGVLDWSIVANHYESLHPSNAICVNWKGIPNGLR